MSLPEHVQGEIVKVISHKTNKWSPAGIPWLVALTDNGNKVMGEMTKPQDGDIKGEQYRFYGNWKPDRRDPRAMVFCFDHYEILVDQSIDGVVDYLSRHVDGVGKVKAKALVEAFGIDTLHVLQTDPGRILDEDLKGFDANLVGKIARHFKDNPRIDPAAYARLVDLLADYTVPRKLIARLLHDFGSNAPEFITAHPYELLNYPRIGWDLVDAFALKKCGYAKDGIERQKAAVIEALRRCVDNGHTVAPRIDVMERAFQLIRMRPTDTTWAALYDDGDIAVADEDADRMGMMTMISPPKLDAAERYIASRLRVLRDHVRPIDLDPEDVKDLSDSQKESVGLVLRSGLAILEGPPGTGKTYSVSHLLDALMDLGVGKIRVMAPTGKAAKRAEELIRAAIGDRVDSIPCTTIHRALGIGPNDDDDDYIPAESAKVGRGRQKFGFEFDEANPLEGQVFVIDEFSMVDTLLAAALFSAIPLGAMVLIVGDANQLPSVGSGSVLRDLIASGIPTASLTEIRRSDGGGTVVKACHAIRAGKYPQPVQKLSLPSENWIHYEIDGAAAIGDKIVELVAKVQAGNKNNFDPMWDVQVISAQHNKPGFGCNMLNDRLSAQLNRCQSRPMGESDDLRFRKGDKVIRRKNGKVDEMLVHPRENYSKPDWIWVESDNGDETAWDFEPTTVVNGDMGIVEDIVITDRGGWAVVRFRSPDRLCRIPLGKSHLQRAYAITVHSSQGSGFPYVIVPVDRGFFFDEREGRGLWCRELIYTAISRAEMILVTVGERAAIDLAVSRRTLHKRQTRLRERIARRDRQAAQLGMVAASGEREAIEYDYTAEEVESIPAVALAVALPAAIVEDALPGDDFDPVDDFMVPDHAISDPVAEAVVSRDRSNFIDLPF